MILWATLNAALAADWLPRACLSDGVVAAGADDVASIFVRPSRLETIRGDFVFSPSPREAAQIWAASERGYSITHVSRTGRLRRRTIRVREGTRRARFVWESPEGGTLVEQDAAGITVNGHRVPPPNDSVYLSDEDWRPVAASRQSPNDLVLFAPGGAISVTRRCEASGCAFYSTLLWSSEPSARWVDFRVGRRGLVALAMNVPYKDADVSTGVVLLEFHDDRATPIVERVSGRFVAASFAEDTEVVGVPSPSEDMPSVTDVASAADAVAVERVRGTFGAAICPSREFVTLWLGSSPPSHLPQAVSHVLPVVSN